ncbi:MAG: BPSS1780 family membrane protein [Pseudomonadota bacterium]
MDIDTPLSPQEPGNDGGEIVHEPHLVVGDRGAGWITEAWDRFKAAPGQWIAFCVVGFVVLCVVNFIPGVNIINAFLQPVWIAGVMAACHAQHKGEAIRISHLFAGFGPKTGRLVVSGLIIMISGVVIVAAVFGPLLLAMLENGDPNAYLATLDPYSLIMRVLIVVALTLPLYAALWFAPALIMLGNTGAIDALRLSFVGCMKNVWPFLIYGLCWLVVGVVLIVVFGLAAAALQSLPFLMLLLLAPLGVVMGAVAYVSVYLSFRDIYID